MAYVVLPASDHEWKGMRITVRRIPSWGRLWNVYVEDDRVTLIVGALDGLAGLLRRLADLYDGADLASSETDWVTEDNDEARRHLSRILDRLQAS